MNIFTWLLLGHLVGDWMFQNDWMARGKQRRLFTKEILVHCLVYTAVVAATLWIATLRYALSPPYITVLAIIFISHWLIDAGNLAGHWVRWLRQSRLPFIRIMVDQTMHIVVLAAVVELGITN
jgi:Protein of unknown function (DUF3307)